MTRTAVDLRRAPLGELRRIDFRDPTRDLWADEAALWDRGTASWAGLDDSAWRLPGAAPSDAGGPDWSFLDHIGHLVDWQEIALEYVARAIETGRWPSDDDYDGGDFDRFNERRRDALAAVSPAELRSRAFASHGELLELVRTLPLATIRSDEAWGWLYSVLHGHQLDHLRVTEPWADQLRVRQTGGDPFGDDPYGRTASESATADFFAAEDATFAQFRSMLATVPDQDWARDELTPGWTFKDHVAHAAAWLEEAVEAHDEWRAARHWRTYTEPEDEWNARAVERWRDVPIGDIGDRLAAARETVLVRARALPPEVLWSYEGIGWTYEVLHGHLRRHLAMVGPWAARLAWPPAP